MQPLSSSNQFVISAVGVSDARSDYHCDVIMDVMGVSTTHTASASLHVTSKYSPSNSDIVYSFISHSTRFLNDLHP